LCDITERNIPENIKIPKNENLSSFTHPQAVPDLHEFLSSVEHNILKIVGNQAIDGGH